MNAYTYDLHMHSALSPCADNDMTPNNMAGFAALAGISIAALTDHNTAANCPAFFEACKRYGIVPVGGMELTTAEEIHIVCLFPTLEAVMDFDGMIRARRMKIKNDPAIFGEQLLFDGEDNVIGSDPYYLPAATDVPLEEVPTLVKRCGGICYPAHIDRPSGGLPAILGGFPPEVPFRCYELRDRANKELYEERFPLLKGMRQICCSDAHRLESISDAENSLLLEDEPYSSALLRISLLKKLSDPTS
jgi:hypothetical protein